MNCILGLNFGHDGAAALVVDGKLKSAISRERITREKKAAGICQSTITYITEDNGITLEDIDAVAFSSYFFKPQDLSSTSFIKFFSKEGQRITSNLAHLISGIPFEEYIIEIGGIRKPAFLIQHHLAHLAAAFYTSPFEKAACFSLDASGVHPEYCSLFATGHDNHLHYYYCPGLMFGNVYSVFTERLGIGPGLTKAGTTMALAAFGTRKEYSEEWKTDFSSWYERKFQPSDAVHTQYLWSKWTGLPPFKSYPSSKDPSQEVKNHAASLQYMFERALVDWACKLHEETKSFNGGNLVLSGGSFLNSDANMKILKESPFERIHLFPACGDDGTAPGAALYLNHALLKKARHNYEAKDYMYLGKNYTSAMDNLDYHSVAKDISEGKIVAWFQGRSEFGPRALGNRSFLADPRSQSIKQKMNDKIKHREWFRPFAPAVLSEDVKDWFDLDFESKLMLFITKILKPEIIPAVSHVDNSARVQTVNENDNSKFYKLIKCFKEITDVPILLNTSLNDNNEPLVETPEDAKKLFESSETDTLVIGNEVFRK